MPVVNSVTSSENEIMERHGELKADLALKIEAQSWWESALETPHVQQVFTAVRDTIQRNRVALETAKSDDIKTLQAQISARKELLELIEANKNTSRVVDARNRLAEFEQHNALFLVDKAKKQSNGKVDERDQRKAAGAGE